MRFFIGFLWLLACYNAGANMASPYQKGTVGVNALASADIDVLHEKILVTPDKDFEKAAWQIEYLIKTDKSGTVPLLFVALDYAEGFKVTVDGQEVTLRPVPIRPGGNDTSAFSGFGVVLDSLDGKGEGKHAIITWKEGHTEQVYLKELKYFELNLQPGQHTVKVSYTGRVSEYNAAWIRHKAFFYSLVPAKFWKSFSGLEITIDGSQYHNNYETNLGAPQSGKTESIATWKFDKLPADQFSLMNVPKVSSLATTLIAVDPSGLAIIAGAVMMAINIWLLWLYRLKKPSGGSPRPMIVGSILVPLLFMVAYFWAYSVIDYFIGPDASRRHGYYFLSIIFYPVLVPVYLLVMWIIDIIIRRRLQPK